MNTGKTLFARSRDFLPWKTFHRIVARHGGDKGVRTLTCAEQFRAMTFAQLTYRESLRDIEACLLAQTANLYHMGFLEPVSGSTLADANESRDWRIWKTFAGRLIIQARQLYLSEDLGLDLSNTVYALNLTTIDPCLSVFPWAHLRTTQAAVKMHTLLVLKGSIASFIHVSNGKLHDVHALDLLELEAGAFFVTRAKSNTKWNRVYLDADRPDCRHHLRSAHRTGRLLHAAGLPCPVAPGSLQRSRDRQDTPLPHQPDDLAGRHHLRALQKPLAGGIVPQVDQAASADQKVLRYTRECGQNANLDRGIGLCARRHRQEEEAATGRLALHFATDFVGHPFRENTFAASLPDQRVHFPRGRTVQPTEFIRDLTGQQ